MPQKRYGSKTKQKSKKNAPGRNVKKDSLASQVRNVDSSDLKSDFDKWPEMARRIWDSPAQPAITSTDYPRRILLAGMGGSGITGEVIADYSRELGSRISYETLKDYHLPSSVSSDTLVIGMS